jgi:hypothetical protein
MDISGLLMLLAGLHPLVPVVLSILGLLTVAGTALVVLTPGKGDDAVLAKLEAAPVIGAVIKALVAFSPIQKK